MTETNVTPEPSNGDAARTLVGAAGRAYARSAQYMVSTANGRRARRFRRSNVPGGSRSLLPASQAILDEMIKVYFQAGRTPFSTISPDVLRVELAEMIDHLAATGSPHHSPLPPDSVEIVRRSFGGLRGEWMTFPSGWSPHLDAPGAERWADDQVNDVMHTALLRHKDHADRPWLVLIHGAEMGRPRLDARILRAKHFYDELGVNVAMPVLPRHGLRGPGVGHLRGEFPSDDLVTNLHGLVQAVWDVRRLLTWIRATGADTIGVYGFSLGGNVTAQLAQHETELAAIIAGCPAVDLAGLVRANMPPGSRRKFGDLFDLAAEASEVVSPLGLPVVAPVESLAIIAGAHDRLADPLGQAARLWTHWGEPEFQVVQRAHVSFMFGQSPTRTIETFLRQRGVVFTGPRPNRRS